MRRFPLEQRQEPNRYVGVGRRLPRSQRFPRLGAGTRGGQARGLDALGGPGGSKAGGARRSGGSGGEPRKRIALLQEFDRLLGQVGPFAPLFQPAVPYVHRSNVQGVAYHSVWAIDVYPTRKTV
jgi:hypothetical protein